MPGLERVKLFENLIKPPGSRWSEIIRFYRRSLLFLGSIIFSWERKGGNIFEENYHVIYGPAKRTVF